MILKMLLEAKELDLNNKKDAKELFKLLKKLVKEIDEGDEIAVSPKDLEDYEKFAKSKGYTIFAANDDQISVGKLLKKYLLSATAYNYFRQFAGRIVQLVKIGEKDGKPAVAFNFLKGGKSQARFVIGLNAKGDKITAIYKKDGKFETIE